MYAQVSHTRERAHQHALLIIRLLLAKVSDDYMTDQVEFRFNMK